MQSLDARYLLCPLPVIRVQEKIEQMDKGEQLGVLCTDPGVLQDIPAWCRIHGHKLLKIEEVDDEYQFLLEVEGIDP